MIAVVFGLFGLIVGSFLNVVILRFGERSVGGRSACPNCNAQLRALDMVPVLSWIFLRGQCRYCKARISVQYPLVEAATAAFFAALGASSLSLISMLLALPIAALLVCIFTYDLKHKLIPDIWVWIFATLALTSGIFNFHFSIFTLLSGPVAALPILFLWYLSKPFTGHAGQWMGFGDVKLALGLGWLLGFPLGFFAIFLAFIIGAVISVCILLPLPFFVEMFQNIYGYTRTPTLALLRAFFGGNTHVLDSAGEIVSSSSTAAQQKIMPMLVSGYTMKSEVPFGPFLIAAGVIVWLVIMYNISNPLPL